MTQAVVFVLTIAVFGTDEPKLKITFPNGAVGGWSPAPARLKQPYFSDREYAFRKLPKELNGATLLLRGADDSSKWLTANKVHVSRACTAFAIVRWKYNEKVVASDKLLQGLEDAGWKRLDAVPDMTAPKGEVWKWSVFEIKIPKGDVDLAAPKDMRWTASVVYGFK